MPSRLDILRRRAPQALLRRLTPTARTREHDLTVMFTDIVGFTRLAESLGHTAVAEMLEHHVAALAARIERERGVVHKVLGDGLLAFWDTARGGASPTAPALRAALAIRDAVEADNAARAARGLARIRLRIGLHTGPLVMAALGAAGRLGTTPLGDTVNVAQRLEDAARHVADGSHEVTIVASDAVVARAGRGFRFEPLGELPVRGRRDPVRAFRLAGA
jgi:adenylate cyclase